MVKRVRRALENDRKMLVRSHFGTISETGQQLELQSGLSQRPKHPHRGRTLCLSSRCFGISSSSAELKIGTNSLRETSDDRGVYEMTASGTGEKLADLFSTTMFCLSLHSPLQLSIGVKTHGRPWKHWCQKKVSFSLAS